MLKNACNSLRLQYQDFALQGIRLKRVWRGCALLEN